MQLTEPGWVVGEADVVVELVVECEEDVVDVVVDPVDDGVELHEAKSAVSEATTMTRTTRGSVTADGFPMW